MSETITTTYRIEITRIETVEMTVTKNFLVEKKPTEFKVEAGMYGTREQTEYEERYEPRDVVETDEEETTIYSQTVESLSLTKVIAAINGINL